MPDGAPNRSRNLAQRPAAVAHVIHPPLSFGHCRPRFLGDSLTPQTRSMSMCSTSSRAPGRSHIAHSRLHSAEPKP